MSERITKSQFAAACNWATQSGYRCGALNEGETIGTSVAWSMSYVVVYAANSGAIVAQLSEPDTTRGLYNRIRAINAAWEFSARNVSALSLAARSN